MKSICLVYQSDLCPQLWLTMISQDLPLRTFFHLLLLISFLTFEDELIELWWLKVKAAGNPFPNHCSPAEMCFRDLLAVILSCLNFGADLTFEFRGTPFFLFSFYFFKSVSFHITQFKLPSGMDKIESEKHTPLLTCNLHLKVITHPAYPDLFSAIDCI